MFDKLRQIFTAIPIVEFSNFEDGLASVKSSKTLSASTNSVKIKTPSGFLTTPVLVESYEKETELFRIRLLEDQAVFTALGIEPPKEPRLPKVIRMTSPHFPGFAGTSEDISTLGAKITTSEALEIAYDIKVKIELDDPEIPPLNVLADVSWTAYRLDGNFHSGLKFQALTFEQTRTIRSYINDRIALEKKLHTIEE